MMGRISLYTDIDNLAEIFALERSTPEFSGIHHFLSKESTITFCETEEVVQYNEAFPLIATELTSGNFEINFRTEEEAFLNPPFKTNLQEYFKDKSTVFFSYDSERIELAKEKSGFIMAGLGQEMDAYYTLNFKKDILRGNRILTLGETFKDYEDMEGFVMPFNEVIINEPYLFKPDRGDWDLSNYMANNFEPLMRSLFKDVKNKVNIVLSTFVNQNGQESYDYFSQEDYDKTGKAFTPLYNYCTEFFNDLLGASRYKLWLIVSPQARKGRHDRFILTNYQYIEVPAGLALFDDRGNFISRGEAAHLYSILYDDARNQLMPSVIRNMQEKVINKILETHEDRIFGLENGNSHYLKFEKPD